LLGFRGVTLDRLGKVWSQFLCCLQGHFQGSWIQWSCRAMALHCRLDYVRFFGVMLALAESSAGFSFGLVP
jgi:hypothetical protein